MKKRLSAILIMALMLFSLLPTEAFAEGNLTVSPTSLTLSVGETKNITLTNNTTSTGTASAAVLDSIECATTDPAPFTSILAPGASLTIPVKGLQAGTATVTIGATTFPPDNQTYSFSVNVTVNAAHTHEKREYYPATDPTCETPGTVEYWDCTGCDKKLDADAKEIADVTDPAKPALGHYFGSGFVNNGNGTHSYTCWNGCDAVGIMDGERAVKGGYEACHYGPNYAPGTGENVGKHIPVCGCGATNGEYVPCTSFTAVSGLTGYYDCTVCGGRHGHRCEDSNHHAAQPATCDVPGTVEYWDCGICGMKFGADLAEIADVTIPALGHNFTGDAVSNQNGTHSFKCVNATCEAVGTMNGQTATKDGSETCAFTGNYVIGENENAGKHAQKCACGAVGEYTAHDFSRGTCVCGAGHEHSFTYAASGAVLTATCTQGCDKGYDTTPLSLTLTAPASLVYDGNAKAFTFADGEAAAWTGAGLELPTITYYQKYSGQGSYTQLNEVPVNAGGDYMAEIVVNNKAAQVKFTIDKATPYIKTNPEPTDIVYGKKLADSTLVGGYVQVSSTNTTQVGGLFEWTNPDTIPARSDSEVTEYDVTFTPADTNNFNTVSCKVKIKVTHAHNPVKVNGQAATETASGWKDYYKCDCGKLFEDADCKVEITDLEKWKAEGGNGYIAPLKPESYTVTFNMNGHGTQVPSQTVEKGKVATKPTDPTAKGWTFGGWYTDVTCQSLYDFSTPINTNLMLHAKWTKNPVGPTPTITPEEAYVVVGQQATFTVQASGEGLSYQWYINRNDGRGWRKLKDATATSYTTAVVDLDCDGFQYGCLVTDRYGNEAKSNIAVLHVSVQPISPQTGDSSRPVLWLAMSMLSVLAILLIRRRKAKD